MVDTPTFSWPIANPIYLVFSFLGNSSVAVTVTDLNEYQDLMTEGRWVTNLSHHKQIELLDTCHYLESRYLHRDYSVCYWSCWRTNRRGFHTQLRVRRCEADSQNPKGLLLSHPRHTYLSMSASSHLIGEQDSIRTRVHFWCRSQKESFSFDMALFKLVIELEWKLSNPSPQWNMSLAEVAHADKSVESCFYSG